MPYKGQIELEMEMIQENPGRFRIDEAMPFVAGLGRPGQSFSIFLIKDIEMSSYYVSWAWTTDDNVDDVCKAIDMSKVVLIKSFQEMKKGRTSKKKAIIEVRKRSARLIVAARKEQPYFDGVKGEIWFVINDEPAPESSGYLTNCQNLSAPLGEIAEGHH